MEWDFGLRLIIYGRVSALNRVFAGTNWDVAVLRFRARSSFRVEAHSARVAGWQGWKCYEVNEASE
jgi:hypothetical protein